MKLNKLKPVLFSLAAFLVFGCAEIEPKPFEASPGHIKSDDKPAGQIPELVQKTPVLPVPQPPVEQEKYTVVVNEVPAKELLFALARDAKINVDIDPRIDGNVTINAVDQTLPQILDRVARQIDMRYEFKGDNLFVQPDEPYFKTYKVDYVNISRDTDSAITIATQIATTGAAFEAGGTGQAGGGGSNNSTTNVTSISKNRFWETLTANVMALLGNPTATSGSAGVQSTDTVIPSPEAGFLTVKANSRQHEKIQGLIDSVMESANRQVLIQATIVEVSLSDQYQAGIDWSFLRKAGKAGFDIVSTTLTGVPVGTLSSFVLDYVDPNVDRDRLQATVSLLDEFGETKVLSSPQLMVLNNQTAILKVVDNVVFFTVEQETNTTQGVVTNTFETTVHTVPVGIVMSVTPQINSNDSVMLNVRPTISRVNQFVNDPNPALAAAGVLNPIPEIQVREMESLLRMNDNQIAVLGGLMQDEARDRTNAIPGVSRLPLLGKAFETKTKEYGKTELVIFLRPVVIRNPSLDGDLDLYKTFLDQQSAAPGFQGAPHP
jgi:general secretion pathway protein D